ncbi:MAG: NACHT domain-containing protein [Candidatus Viridilinea halotolerans]|uniref:NACHT domain-containing protein n=1 Tax=Candidatus Viridilinea halotolerans TaxID=2491704 RepID=A0A426U2A2_9CHLR|nr:MAG: NACHT domain-containing protein [Candidatus Viridilinea halotolerans]
MSIISLLERWGIAPSAEDLADIYLLAARMAQSAPAAASSATAGQQAVPEAEPPPMPAQGRDHAPPSAPIPRSSHAEGQVTPPPLADSPPAVEVPEQSVPIHGYQQTPLGAQRDDLPIALPSGPALSQQLALARALRPLMRRVPSHVRSTLDEQKSAEQIADSRILLPVLRPEAARWLDIMLVLDRAPSMAIWRQAIDEWRVLLERMGAFRDVRLWSLATSERTRAELSAGWQRQRGMARNPGELIDPSGRRLIILLSDCVAPAWQSGAVQQLLLRWGSRNHVALLQMLPPDLWLRSTLGMYEEALVSATSAAAPTAQLTLREAERIGTGIPLPVLSLSKTALHNWACLISGSRATMPGFWLTAERFAEEEAVEQAQLNGAERVERFKFFASEAAWRLAQALAVAPLSPPIMRLVHQASIEHPSTNQLAEVMLGGLLRRIPGYGEDFSVDEVQYEFYDGVRERLLDGRPVAEQLGILERVAQFIGARHGRSFSFRGLLLNPDAADVAALHAANPHFARLAVEVLRSMGGRYAALGERLRFHDADLSSISSTASSGYEGGDETNNFTNGLRRYLNLLYAIHATIDLRGIDDRPMDMPLNEIYVSLNLYEPQPDALVEHGGLRGFFEQARKRFTGKRDPVDQQDTWQSETVDWATALRHPRLVVLGVPGSGKTILLEYIAVRLAEVVLHENAALLTELGLADESHDEPLVPLLLPLRELGGFVSEYECSEREAMGANPQLLLDCLAEYYRCFALELPADFFSRLVETGRALLLLDGLDEVVSREDREFVSAVVRSVATRYPHCRYVVTARVAAYQGDAQIDAGFRICTVADLSTEQQQRFIANWSRSLHRLLHDLHGDDLERAAQRYADNLWEALKLNGRVRDLATNPLLLTVVAVIFYNNHVLPENRAALYEECIKVLLRGGRGKADRSGQRRGNYSGRPELKMGLDPKRDLLAAVAYAMHLRGEEGVFLSRNELVRAAATYFERRVPDAEAAARDFVAELPVHIGLLDEHGPDHFRFIYLFFQEFLAARFIAENDRWEELLDRYQNIWWREVILLCAGHLSQDRCWRFLGQLIERGRTPSQRVDALALAAAALTELEKFKGQGPLTARIQHEALTILEQQPATAIPAAVRVQSGAVLAVVGDPRPGVCTLPPPFVAFAGGMFLMGESKEETRFDNEINNQLLQIPPFEIARYPVTNSQFQLFIEVGGYDTAAPWWSKFGVVWLQQAKIQAPRYWNDTNLGIIYANHPVVGVSWYEAVAFCAWLTHHINDGSVYTLPSEAEWEYAARGLQRRSYPWGEDGPDPERANYNEVHRRTTPVGCFPLGATPEGVLDMAGNVWEWTRSTYQPYPYDPEDGREDGDVSASKSFVLRGGSWGDPQFRLRAAFRSPNSPENFDVRLPLSDGIGFRLVRHLLYARKIS